MKHLLEFEIFKPINEETFSAYHGRYSFDIDKAYRMIKNGKVKSEEKRYNPDFMHYLSHPEFNVADPKKVKSMRVSYDKPIGIVVKFRDPESGKEEWMLIDGNHRTRKAIEENKPAIYYVIKDPNDVNKFMKFDSRIPHKAFIDDLDERISFLSSNI